MIKATDPEFKIQSEFITYLKMKYPDLLYTISPAGFIMSAGMAMKMMRMGYQKGTPDLLILEPRASYHGLLIEFKAPGGTTSPNQDTFLAQAAKRLYKVHVCYSVDEAIKHAEWYLTL